VSPLDGLSRFRRLTRHIEENSQEMAFKFPVLGEMCAANADRTANFELGPHKNLVAELTGLVASHSLRW
jgi:hypothetical protein